MRFLLNKLHNACELMSKTLNKKSIMFFASLTLTGFSPFYAKVMSLSWVFIRFIWDFRVNFLLGNTSFCRETSQQVGDNLSLWNNLLLKFNGVLFFDNKRRKPYLLYLDALLVFWSFCRKRLSACWIVVMIEQNTTLVTKTKNCQGSYLLNRSRESIICALF